MYHFLNLTTDLERTLSDSHDCLVGKVNPGGTTAMMVILLLRSVRARRMDQSLRVSVSVLLCSSVSLTTATAADVIGCGIDYSSGQAFFTKNGRYLGDSAPIYNGMLANRKF